MRSADVFSIIRDTGIVAILRGINEQDSLRIVEALCNSGIKAIEITFNTPNADKILSKIAQEYQGSIIVGAGTVINPLAAVRAVECGAEFILAPNTDEAVISIAKKYGKLMIPGAFTATEILKCYEMGADIVKIFPASSVGPKYIKDLRGPFNHIDMMPVGGVDVNNVRDFIKAGSIAVGVGGSLFKKEFIKKGNFKSINELAIRFIEEIKEARNLV